MLPPAARSPHCSPAAGTRLRSEGTRAVQGRPFCSFGVHEKDPGSSRLYREENRASGNETWGRFSDPPPPTPAAPPLAEGVYQMCLLLPGIRLPLALLFQP